MKIIMFIVLFNLKDKQCYKHWIENFLLHCKIQIDLRDAGIPISHVIEEEKELLIKRLLYKS